MAGAKTPSSRPHRAQTRSRSMLGKGQQLEGGAAAAVAVDRRRPWRSASSGRERQAVEQARGRPPGASRLGGERPRRARPRRSPAPARGRQPLVGVVGAQAQAVLGARGEHAVGLGHAARDQVVDHHADVGRRRATARNRAPAAARLQRGVEAGDEPCAPASS